MKLYILLVALESNNLAIIKGCINNEKLTGRHLITSSIGGSSVKKVFRLS